MAPAVTAAAPNLSVVNPQRRPLHPAQELAEGVAAVAAPPLLRLAHLEEGEEQRAVAAHRAAPTPRGFSARRPSALAGSPRIHFHLHRRLGRLDRRRAVPAPRVSEALVSEFVVHHCMSEEKIASIIVILPFRSSF